MIMFENYKRIRKNPSKSNDWEAQHFKQSQTILKRNLFEGSFKRISSKSPIIPRHSTSKNLEQLLRCLKNPPEPLKKKIPKKFNNSEDPSKMAESRIEILKWYQIATWYNINRIHRIV